MAFDHIKNCLTSESLLIFPDFNKRFYLATDASDISIAGTLSQKDENDFLRPIAHTGRALRNSELNYSITHRELLAVIFSLEQFRIYLESAEFDIQTDNKALTFLMTQKHVLQRLIRWQIFLNGYKFKMTHLKGSLNTVPDALSRRNYDYNTSEADKRVDSFVESISELAPVTRSAKLSQTTVKNKDENTKESNISRYNLRIRKPQVKTVPIFNKNMAVLPSGRKFFLCVFFVP